MWFIVCWVDECVILMLCICMCLFVWMGVVVMLMICLYLCIGWFIVMLCNVILWLVGMVLWVVNLVLSVVLGVSVICVMVMLLLGVRRMRDVLDMVFCGFNMGWLVWCLGVVG